MVYLNEGTEELGNEKESMVAMTTWMNLKNNVLCRRNLTNEYMLRFLTMKSESRQKPSMAKTKSRTMVASAV